MAKKTSDAPESKPVVDVGQIQEFSKQYRNSAATVASKQSDHSNLVKRIEKAGVNKQAFIWAMQLAKLEPTRAQQVMRDLTLYCQAVGIYDQQDFVEASGGDELEPEKPARKKAKTGESIPAEQVDEIAEAMGVDAESSDAEDYREAGRQACRAGAKVLDNPYDDEDDDAGKHQAWQTGWTEAYQNQEWGVDKPEPVEEDASSDAAA